MSYNRVKKEMKCIFLLFFVAIFSLMIPQAFAQTITTTDLPVDINYDNITREISVEWDFDDDPNRTKCILKDVTVIDTSRDHAPHDYIETKDTKEIPCTGSMTISIEDNVTEVWIELLFIDDTPRNLTHVFFLWLENSTKDVMGCSYNEHDYNINYVYDIEKISKTVSYKDCIIDTDDSSVELEYVDLTDLNAPTGLTATTISSTRIDLSWSAPLDTGGVTIIGYQIERQTPTGTISFTIGSRDTTYSDISLTVGTTYTYRVSAVVTFDQITILIGNPSESSTSTTFDFLDVSTLSVDINYDNITREISVEWDFDDDPNRTKCILSKTLMINGVNLTPVVKDIPCSGSTTISIEKDVTDFVMVLSFDDDNLRKLTNVYFMWSSYAIVDFYGCFYNEYDYDLHYTYGIEKIIKTVSEKGCEPFSDDFTLLQYVDLTVVNAEPNVILETPKKGGGCSGDCTKPTFFKNKMGVEIVKNGFEFNGNATDVINRHVPWDLIILNTNQTYNMKLKVYEINNLKWIGVYFGLPEIGSPLNYAESDVIFHLNYTKNIEEIVTVDKFTLIDIISSNVTMTDCGYTKSQCYLLDFDFVFRDELKNNIVGIQAVDRRGNSASHYINDGIQAVGESMNVPLISQVTASKGGAFYPQKAGIVELTLISYKDDLWQDEYGYLWTADSYKSFRIVDIIPVPIKEPDVMWAAMTRMNSHFSDMIQYEKDRAVLIFDGSKLIKEIGESFTYELPQSEEEYNKELAIKLEIEAEKACKLIKQCKL